MSTYYVTKVRKERVTNSSGQSHKHITGVITTADIYYSNGEVVSSIDAKNEWYTSVPGEPKAKIKPLSYCPNSTCYHKPYLTTEADASAKNNLENLPEG